MTMLSLLLLLGACTEPISSETKDFESTLAMQGTSPPTVSSSSATEESEPVEIITLSPEEAKAMIDQGGITIVDVRRADEYAAGHIEGALLVPNKTILTNAATALPDKDAVILVYCRSGRRSREAAEKLISIGYRHIYDFGGILSWPYGTVTE